MNKMLAAIEPDDEAERIAALRSLKIFDTAPEERFDRLTRLAKRLFDVPITLVSLVDENRQWFKSCVGINTRETSRDISFCAHAITSRDILVVPDARLDVRFHDNPLVRSDPGIRFYAGYPLTLPNGVKLGTLCVMDRLPRSFDSEERELLRDLGRMAEQEIAALQLATMDELTLLSNRRGFQALAQHALNVSERLGRTASLLFFDLNDFKKINDTYGHAEGDRALGAFAEVLRDALRDSDVIGRIGGDEFCVLLTGVQPDEIAAVLRRLREMLKQRTIRVQRGYDIDFSVGQTQFDPARHVSIADLMADSDTRMYLQKQSLKRSTFSSDGT
jgi:diguanylate cyclase (GGDEF)-like protein